MSRSILLIDDEAEMLRTLSRHFERRGWEVLTAGEASGAALVYDRDRPDLVLLDLHMPGLSGLQLLEILRLRDPDATILLLTGDADVSTAVEAMRLGAENFLVKPIELPHLDAAVERAFEKVELRRRNRYLTELQADSANGTEALGESPQMREVAKQVEILAASDATVLLLGETGTGKGYVAHMIHALSRRASAPFVEINCAGLSASFLDSELFGHEKGAFTDAREQKRGMFEVADSGSVFLDEVGDLSGELQPKLLKVLESHRFRRLGGTRELEVDVRLIAATNHDLEAAVRNGRFREDLFYRLNVLPLHLPPLRERGRQEVADLAMRVLVDLRRRLGRGPHRFSHAALASLAQYAWPGNIRELRNIVERVLLLAGPDVEEVAPAHLPAEIRTAAAPPEATADVELPLDEVERRHIARVLAHVGGNRSRAARVLGISRATLYEKLGRYDLGGIGRPGAPARR
jgi:two-component system, NtrC family, response regulator AtoC